MNILITTFSLLILLGNSASLFWKQAKGSAETLMAVRGFFEAARTTQNKGEQKLFQRLQSYPPTPSANKKEEKASKNKTKAFASHRLENPPLEQGRIHIAALWQKEHTPLIQPFFLKLLQELYGHTSWYNEQKIQKLITILIQTQNFSAEEFGKRLDTDLYSVWYRIMKGTQIYDTEKRIGYPPLEDFVDFSAAPPKHLCHFPFASLPILRALFGNEMTQTILDLEKAKWEENQKHRYCTKKELLSLIAKDRRSSELLNTIETFCYFNRSIGKRSFVQGVEEKSGIALRKSLKKDAQGAKS